MVASHRQYRSTPRRLTCHGVLWADAVGTRLGVRRLIIYQGERFDHYRQALTKLDTFPCGCSRKQLEIHGGAAHPPPCSNAERQPSIRHLSAPFDVLWRRDDLPSYHLACAVDEIEMGITHVLRGDDLRFADNIQAALIQELGASPPRYASVPVVRQPNGQNCPSKTWPRL